jgi:hypothetical protein
LEPQIAHNFGKRQRLAFEERFGYMPPFVVTSCGEIDCVTPEHLIAVEAEEYHSRFPGLAGHRSGVRSGGCKRGHDPDDIYFSQRGNRYCRTCVKENNAAAYAKSNGKRERPAKLKHGSLNAYRLWGCRCESCKNTGQEYLARLREKYDRRKP